MRHKQLAMRIWQCRVEALERRRLLTTYFVDNAAGDNGSDSNNGTSLATPFLTIQQAATVAQPGDVVDILAGTYRETVTPANSGTAAAPITYQAYNNENVVIDGANLVGGWTSYNGSIYQTSSMSWTMGGQDDQIFVDGQMMNYARWPNTSLDVSQPNVELAGANTTGIQNSNGTITNVIYDTHLTQPAGYWNGATIHIEPGQTWLYEAATITSYTRAVVNGVSYGVITYTSSFTDAGFYLAQPGNPYYITGDPYFAAGQSGGQPAGAFQNLDSAGEFYRDPNTGELYLWTPDGDSPAAHVIEAKARTWAFDLSGLSYIDITGINIFAAGINSSSTSNHLLINGITAQYVSHFENYSGNWIATLSNGTDVIGGTGIVLDGGFDTLENSTIAFSAGDGVYLGGNNNTIYNNVIHDVGYSGLNCAAIDSAEFTSNFWSGNTISFNTLYNGDRSLINASALTSSRIDNNRMWNAMLQAGDGAAIYVYEGNGNGTEIDHNVISNVENQVAGYPTCGIFLDDFTTGFTLDHNVIYGATDGIKAFESYANNIINNTIFDTSSALELYGGTLTGLIVNNITTSNYNIILWTTQPTMSNNLQAAANPLFVSASTGNFQLQSNSPAINAGIPEAPYTNGYLGTEPDEGAYEFGVPAWTSGASNTAAVQAAMAVPIPWTSGDIGSPSFAGNTTYSNGVFAVSGAGTDIWNSADQFQFADVPTSGDQTIIARLTTQTNTAGWAKAGVMFRSTSAANSPFVMVVQTPDFGVNLMWRDASGNLNADEGAAVANPVWLKLVRVGNVFTGYDSADGINWTTLGSVTISLPAAGLTGLAVTSRNANLISTAVFDDVSVQAVAAGPTFTAVSTSSVSLSWNAVASTGGYQVQRSTDGINFSTIATLGNVTSYTDSNGLSAGTEYYYRLIYATLLNPSTTSSSAAAVTLTLAPAALTAVPGAGQIALSWNASAGAVSYDIYRGTASGGESSTPLATGITTTTYTDNTATPGTTFYYTVAAVNADAPLLPALNSQSAASNEASGSSSPVLSSGPAQLTGTTIGTAGSYQNDGNTIAKATDGSLTTFFDAPSPNGNWVGLDLGPTGGIVTEIKYASRTNWAARMNGGVFQASNSAAFTLGVVNLYTIAANANPSSTSLTTQTLTNTTAYRYYRYLSPSGGYGNVSEIQFFGTPGGLTILTQLNGITIGTTGSYQNDGNTIAKATDGNLNTFFDGPTASGDWVGLDLGTAQVIQQISFAPRVNWAARMVGGIFQASNTPDFSSGVVNLYTITTTPVQGVLTNVTINVTTAYRYVRYLSPANSYGNISEFQVFG